MTDEFDKPAEQLLAPELAAEHARSASKHIEENLDDFENEEDEDEDFSSADMGAGDDEGGSGLNQEELTPNDIFGLDPLDVLTLEDLAEYLQVSVSAVKRSIKDQNLPGRNIGGEWRFLRDAVANWLRGQEAPAQTQQKAREEFSKAPEEERFPRPPKRPYQADESSGGEYRPRTRFGEGDQQAGGQKYGNRQGGYGTGNQYGVGSSEGEGQFQGGNQGGYGSGYNRPPRRPFQAGGNRYGNAGGSDTDENQGGGYRTGENQGGGYRQGGYQGGGYGQGSNQGGGYRPGGSTGGGYRAGGEPFSGPPKRRNKRQVFENERGKRMDRRKEGDAPDEAQ